MNKKILLILLFSVLFINLFAFSAYAAPQRNGGNIGDTLYSVLGWIGGIDLAQIGGMDDAGVRATFYAKFLLWILLFTVLFYVSVALFKGNKKIAGTLSAVIAIIATLGIPGELLSNIFESYSVVFALILMGIPIIAVVMISRKVTAGFANKRAGHIVNAAMFLVLSFLLGNFTTSLDLWFTEGRGLAIPNVTRWTGFALSIVMIMFIYNLIKAIFPGGAPGPTVGEAAGWDGKKGAAGGKAAGSLLKKVFTRTEKEEVVEFKEIKEVIDLLEHAKASIKHASEYGVKDEEKKNAIKAVLGEIEEAEKIDKNIEMFAKYIRNLQNNLKEKNKKLKKEAKIEIPLETGIYSEVNTVINYLNEVKTYLRNIIEGGGDRLTEYKNPIINNLDYAISDLKKALTQAEEAYMLTKKEEKES